MCGVLISFEGIEGCGKSTQSRMLREKLSELGFDVVLTREPGGTPIAERIRAILLNGESAGLTARAEALLMVASRAQLASEIILPALDRGAVVIADRYADSSVAYQGVARQIGVQNIQKLNEFATQGTEPNLTLILDVDVELGLSRLSSSDRIGLDRIESETVQFHSRVREAYLEMAKREPRRMKIINGAMAADEVFREVWKRVASLSEIKERLKT
jgi:dTMP kinase